MDSYHFTGGITLQEFIHKAGFYGIKLKEFVDKLNLDETKIKYFERDFDGQKITVMVPTPDFSTELSFYTLRQLCNQLQVPMKSFAVQI